MSYRDKITTLSGAVEIVNDWKAAGEKVVFTNGCFDLLHPGHLYVLEEAAKSGTKLIVAVNADSSVKLLKGPTRPVQDENSRAMLLAALEFTDIVVIFEEETPLRLIEALVPDVLVKGGDYINEQIVGQGFVIGNGGEVVIVPTQKGHSTSNLIEKLK